MAKNDERNEFQITRKDNRGCFVEVKSDWFSRKQIHLEYATYDSKRPKGERYTNHVNIYLDDAKFLALAAEVSGGILLNELRYPHLELEKPLFESMGGTSADKLAYYGGARADGMSQSRVMRIWRSNKKDCVLLVAESGPGETNKTGLVVPRYGKNPENHVSVVLSYTQLEELLLPAVNEYQAYTAAVMLLRVQSGEFERALDFTNNRPQQQGAQNQQNGQIYYPQNPPEYPQQMPGAVNYNG